MKSHFLISVTGRAGTTFLIRLLGELGEDTGFTNPEHGEINFLCEGPAGARLAARNRRI